MDRYTVTFPNYTIGTEAYETIREECPRYGKTVVVIGGRRGVAAAQEKMVKAVEGVGLEFTGFILAGSQPSENNMRKVGHDPAVQAADMIFAVGGGKVMDIAKVVASRLNKPFFAFPTVAGSCAAASSIATLYTDDGHFAGYEHTEKPPVHVFLCTRIMAEAPVEFLLRGMADTMAKYYEAHIASRGHQLKHRDAMGVTLSSMCAAPLYQYGAQAVEDNKKHIASDAFAEVVLAVVMTSGLVSNFAAPEYNGHMAHTLFVELANLDSKEERCRQHGGFVSYGLLLLLLCDNQQEEFESFYAFCRSVGLPTTREGIGASEADIQRVFRATAKNQDTLVQPYKITNDMLKKAAAQLEEYARKK